MRVDAEEYLRSLTGVRLSTLTGHPNTILRVGGSDVFVATSKSPEGKGVSISEIQRAMDTLLAKGSITVNVETVGYRSAFVGAVLATLPGVRTEINPRRVLLEHPSLLPDGAVELGGLESEKSHDGSRVCETDDPIVVAAVQALAAAPELLSVSDLLTALANDPPGLYAWWVDQSGARDLTEGAGFMVNGGLLYAGQGGASRASSGPQKRTGLRNRIIHMHLGNSINFSTFRLSLAATLKDVLELEVVASRTLHPTSESRLSSWMLEHLRVAIYPSVDRDVLRVAEHTVLLQLDPPFNLDQVPRTRERKTLSSLRAVITKAAI